MTETIVNNVATPAPKGNIAKALVAFQAEIPSVSKDGTADAGKYSYGYATLEKLVNVIFPLLTKNGLAYTAVPDWTEQGFGLRATLLHESGEEITGFYPLGNPNNPAQAIGSAISYARRYALLSLTGVAPAGEDDDGVAAQAAPASAPAGEPAATKETAEDVRTEMSDTIAGSKGLLKTDDANDVMKLVTTAPKTPKGKEIADWTLADMKKGRDALYTLLKERQAAAEAK